MSEASDARQTYRPICGVTCTNHGMCTVPADSEISPETLAREGVYAVHFGCADTTITARIHSTSSAVSRPVAAVHRVNRKATTENTECT